MPLTQEEANYIFENTVGCRYGTDTRGAAYSFMDIVGSGEDNQDPSMKQTTAWLLDPNAAAFQPRWDNRLWNTCGFIISLNATGTVILVSSAHATAERYRYNNNAAKGDSYTFSKCNRLPENSQILSRIDYDYRDEEATPEQEDIVEALDSTEITKRQVQKLYNKMMEALKKLASSSAIQWNDETGGAKVFPKIQSKDTFTTDITDADQVSKWEKVLNSNEQAIRNEDGDEVTLTIIKEIIVITDLLTLASLIAYAISRGYRITAKKTTKTMQFKFKTKRKVLYKVSGIYTPSNEEDVSLDAILTDKDGKELGTLQIIRCEPE